MMTPNDSQKELDNIRLAKMVAEMTSEKMKLEADLLASNLRGEKMREALAEASDVFEEASIEGYAADKVEEALSLPNPTNLLSAYRAEEYKELHRLRSEADKLRGAKDRRIKAADARLKFFEDNPRWIDNHGAFADQLQALLQEELDSREALVHLSSVIGEPKP